MEDVSRGTVSTFFVCQANKVVLLVKLMWMKITVGTEKSSRYDT